MTVAAIEKDPRKYCTNCIFTGGVIVPASGDTKASCLYSEKAKAYHAKHKGATQNVFPELTYEEMFDGLTYCTTYGALYYSEQEASEH